MHFIVTFDQIPYSVQTLDGFPEGSVLSSQIYIMVVPSSVPPSSPLIVVLCICLGGPQSAKRIIKHIPIPIKSNELNITHTF